MEKQKARARNAAVVENSDWVELREGEQQFVGYDYTEYSCHILRYRKVTQKKASYYELVLDYTPFYGEMGGQVGDRGVLVSEEETIEITDTKRENNQSIHIVKELPKNVEAEFMACVDTDLREASAANHTATHLLDYALKQVLGDHVEQKGSYVSADTLRFDFSHFQKVTDEEMPSRWAPSPSSARNTATRCVWCASVRAVSSVAVCMPAPPATSACSRS